MLLQTLLPLAPLGALAYSSLQTQTNPLSKRDDEFNWTSIHPTPDLQYHDCYTTFKCARLQVPLDWSLDAPTNLTTNTSFAIAIVTLPATVPATDPSFGGTIVTNPGGPGGSGTDFGLSSSTRLQQILEGEKHYEILSFDPRGVYRTTPTLDCYEGDVATRLVEILQTRGVGRIGEEPDGVRDRYLMAQAASRLCEEVTANVLPHISTASVARDMVEIVDRVEELRRTETNRTATEVPRLNLLGISYGSALGMTFSAMFPERVGKVMIDGILDIDDYTSGEWRKNLDDAEAVLDDFYQNCFDANCTLRNPSDSNWTAIRDRVSAFLTEFERNPVPAFRNKQPTVLTSDDMRDQMLLALYGPNVTSEGLAQTLSDTIEGNYTTLATAVLISDDELLASPYLWSRDVRTAVGFADAVPEAGNKTLEQRQADVQFLTEQAPTLAGTLWPDITIAMSGRTVRPRYSFTGPYTVPVADPHNASTPAAPLLFLSARLDPVTPLRNAQAMAERFPGSSVMIQESAGHSALFSSDSECTNAVLREFFGTGKVPEMNFSCEADCKPFVGCKTANGTFVGEDLQVRREPFLPRMI
ncbi:alpha/beta-hydrolase [Pseudovirgaria hyperparasitica]|uniref:Alpha/beta-hydrolase n=1 Tax=Pseudovirgaria hyperparasitica TaxID=470096 RepID=A0A6A6W5S3_9PEZI|nr:alpha/beta-hydrolase [Pseudovirgaria hyperparasitica]KAF2757953.1 alpha/beta-hydrolase [Pseudovirgaria hyperparasitica]